MPCRYAGHPMRISGVSRAMGTPEIDIEILVGFFTCKNIFFAGFSLTYYKISIL
jgi:hypothetical protein